MSVISLIVRVVLVLILIGVLLTNRGSAEPAGLPPPGPKKLYRVGIIDSGFILSEDTAWVKLCPEGHWDFPSNSPSIARPDFSHGTSVAKVFQATIDASGHTEDVCIVVLRLSEKADPSKIAAIESMTRALDMATRLGLVAVNMSAYTDIGMPRLWGAVKRYTDRGVLFTAAANDGDILGSDGTCFVFPPCWGYKIPNMFVVGAFDSGVFFGKKSLPKGVKLKRKQLGRYQIYPAPYSNRGELVMTYLPGDIPTGEEGTSFASPRAMADYINGLIEFEK